MGCAACTTGSVNASALLLVSRKAVRYAISVRQSDGACSRLDILRDFCYKYIACQVMRKHHLHDKIAKTFKTYSKYTGNEHAREYSEC